MRKQLSLKAAAQAGFTLIELIIVIVIIGILAAVAIPKYQDLTESANDASVQGVAGSVASASAVNYALVSAGKTGATVTSCAEALAAANLTSGSGTWTATQTGTCAAGGDTITCAITNGSTSTANATVMCSGGAAAN